MKLLTNFFMTLAAAGLLASCSDSTNEGTATMQVRLTDAPGDYEEVNVDIQNVEYSTEGGWVTVGDFQPAVVNLLDYSNGLDTLLGTAEVPTGRVNQIRLVLGDANTVVVDGVSHPLATPSAQQSGLKLNLMADLLGGVLYTFTLDFDAGMSVVETGEGSYILKPVIRVYEEALTGAIAGTISPEMVSAVVYAIDENQDSASAIPGLDGSFLLPGLTGTFTVAVDVAEGEGYDDLVIDDVTAEVGTVEDLGTLELTETAPQ